MFTIPLSIYIITVSFSTWLCLYGFIEILSRKIILERGEVCKTPKIVKEIFFYSPRILRPNFYIRYVEIVYSIVVSIIGFWYIMIGIDMNTWGNIQGIQVGYSLYYLFIYLGKYDLFTSLKNVDFSHGRYLTPVNRFICSIVTFFFYPRISVSLHVMGSNSVFSNLKFFMIDGKSKDSYPLIFSLSKFFLFTSQLTSIFCTLQILHSFIV